MVAVGALLASAVVKMAGDKLGSFIAEQASLVWNVRKHMEDMKDTLETMAAVLEDAEKRSITEASVRLWLKRLKNTANDISDMLDDFQEASTHQMTGIIPIAIRKNFQANKMKTIREELRKIESLHTSFKFVPSTIDIIDQNPYDPRETTSDVNDSDIRGRDTEVLQLIELLSACPDEDHTMILPIYGLGGIGKSTLAAHVYSNIQFKEYDHRVWVYVSQVFDLKTIGRSIIFQLPTGGQRKTDTLQLINRCLDDLLRGKKVLIVLDDIWEEDQSELYKLKTMLHKQGSMIHVVVTTRNEEIARKICTCEPYKLQPLKDDICWDIIKRSSQFEYKASKKLLEQIGFDIAKKCGGVALAAQALGYMLKSKDLNGWLEINNSDIWNESSRDDNPRCMEVLPSLKLSYERMPPVLRLCFSCCAIFPKGHGNTESDLIHQWVALDFIKPSQGKDYMKQLLGMSFLQHSKLPSVFAEHVVRYTMHDLVHDLARSVIGDELIIIDAAKKSSTCAQKSARYALVTDYDGQTKLSNFLPKKVRMLHFSNSRKLDLSAGSFSFAKHLRILDFSGCSSVVLPTSVSQLKQLRYLIAPEIQNKRPPECFAELSKLQYLSMRGSCRISALPESVGKLGCLVYLDLSDCSGISELPDSIGNLTDLQHLELSRCFCVEEIPESLCGLTKLQYLNLSFCRLGRLPGTIGKLVNLQYLNLSNCKQIRELPESFIKLRTLLHLELTSCHIWKGLQGALCGLTRLQHLDMSDMQSDRYGLFGHEDISDALGNLTNLKYLSLRRSMASLFGNGNLNFIGALTSLEHLDLSFNWGLICLPESIGNLKRLHTLNLSMCRKLKSLPKSIGAIKLKYLLVDMCSPELIDQANSLFNNYILTLPLFKVRAAAADVSACSNLHLLEGVDVRELRIRALENVRCLEEARKVKLLDKQHLSNLKLDWTLDADRVLEDKDLLGQLVPPEGLEYLVLQGYSSTGFPSWVMGISRHLPNLGSISLCDMPTCSRLPPIGQLPNLRHVSLIRLRMITKIDKDFGGGAGAFRQLSSFTMEHMEAIEECSTTYAGEDGDEVFMFPVLDKLRIVSCPRLRLKPCPPTFRECTLDRSDQVISSMGELENVSHPSSYTRSTKLQVWKSDCQSMRLLRHFPALQDLDFILCRNLTSLPESMLHLSALQSLKLGFCDNMSALPEWLGNLSALRSLTIQGCHIVKSLPPCIQQLTKLHELQIADNSKLKKWCESEENKMKLAHINDIVSSLLNCILFDFILPIFFPSKLRAHLLRDKQLKFSIFRHAGTLYVLVVQ